MPGRNGQIADSRKLAGIKRGKAKTRTAKDTSLRPKTQVSVVEGFSNVLTANDNAIKITYTR
jgi:hypothetical protein